MGVKGNRQSYIVTNNPSSIDANELLTVRFPNLHANDVIVPGTARLAFNITPIEPLLTTLAGDCKEDFCEV